MEFSSNRVTIAPENGQHGDWSYTIVDKQQIRNLCIATFAGYLGELLVDPDSPPSFGAVDRREVAGFIKKFHLPDSIETLEREAKDLVRRFSDIIRVFAGELLKRETIGGNDCEALFQSLVASVTTS